MSDVQTHDTHESASMAQPPSHAEVDGWEVESSSAIQPSNEELAASLSDEPAPAPASAPDPISEDHDDAPAAPASSETPNTAKKKLTAAERKAVLQAEINALTRQKHEAAREYEAYQARMQELQRTAKPATPDEVPAKAAPETLPDGVPPEPDWDEYEARGESFSKYQKDHASWVRKVVTVEAEQRARAIADQRIEAERDRARQVALEARHEVRVQTAQERYPDFTEVVSANLSDIPQTPFMAAVVRNHDKGMDLLYHLAQHPAEAQILTQLPPTRPLMDAVRESDDPVALLSYVAQHPDEYTRIASLDAPRQLLALGRLNASLTVGAKTGSPASARPVTTAKPPIRPLGATRSASVNTDGEDLEFGPEYVRRENERRAQSVRR